jgi:ferric iron reductase protein FhuF
MKGSVPRQRCALAGAPPSTLDAKVKCVTVLVFEDLGKTVIQPLVTNDDDVLTVQKLLQNATLEVWLPNGKADPSQFDIAILKYKQLMQPSTMCSKKRNHVCLKNTFETIVACEQCPLSEDGAEE